MSMVEKRYPKPPFPHAELTTLKVFCKKIGIPLEVALEKLKTHGVKASPNKKLSEIAKKNSLTQKEIYEILISC